MRARKQSGQRQPRIYGKNAFIKEVKENGVLKMKIYNKVKTKKDGTT